MQEEIWRDIAGYEGIYQVSNLGNVKSVSRTITYRGKNKFCTISAPIKEKVLKQVRGAGGRMYVSLRKDGKTKILFVSNIVADTFVENTKMLPNVIHKNGNLSDNRAVNLEWSLSEDSHSNSNVHFKENGEEWRSVVGYEGLYEVSNEGNVRSVVRHKEYVSKITGQPSFLTFGGNYLKGYCNKQGYCIVSLSKDGRVKSVGIHRLVAEAFIPNPENKPFVDHINTLPYDNRVDNLRWVDSVENANNELTILHTTGYGSQFRSGGNAKTRARARKKKGIGVDSYSTTACLTEKTKEGAFVRLLAHDGKKICDFGVSYDSLVLLNKEIEQYIQETKKTSVLM